jgi:hypothetical protein
VKWQFSGWFFAFYKLLYELLFFLPKNAHFKSEQLIHPNEQSLFGGHIFWTTFLCRQKCHPIYNMQLARQHVDIIAAKPITFLSKIRLQSALAKCTCGHFTAHNIVAPPNRMLHTYR